MMNWQLQPEMFANLPARTSQSCVDGVTLQFESNSRLPRWKLCTTGGQILLCDDAVSEESARVNSASWSFQKSCRRFLLPIAVLSGFGFSGKINRSRSCLHAGLGTLFCIWDLLAAWGRVRIIRKLKELGADPPKLCIEWFDVARTYFNQQFYYFCSILYSFSNNEIWNMIPTQNLLLKNTCIILKNLNLKAVIQFVQNIKIKD